MTLCCFNQLLRQRRRRVNSVLVLFIVLFSSAPAAEAVVFSSRFSVEKLVALIRRYVVLSLVLFFRLTDLDQICHHHLVDIVVQDV